MKTINTKKVTPVGPDPGEPARAYVAAQVVRLVETVGIDALMIAVANHFIESYNQNKDFDYRVSGRRRKIAARTMKTAALAVVATFHGAFDEEE